MNAIKGYSGNAVCVTTRETSPDANLPDKLRSLTEEELDAELRRRIMQLDEEQCAEFLEFVKMVRQMSDEKVHAELERIRAERAQKEVTS